MNVLLFTSVPLTPPWDQGDKNLAYQLTRALPQVQFGVLGTRQQAPPPNANLTAWPLFENSAPGPLQKALVWLRLAWLLRHDLPQRHGVVDSRTPDVIHYLYRPYPFSSAMLRRIPALGVIPGIHTLPASADGKPIQKELFLARHTVSCSRHGLHKLQQAGVTHVSHIPPGICLNDWQAAGKNSAQSRQRLGLDGATTLLFPGHYGPGMGAGTVVQALPELAASLPNLRVIFACRKRSRLDQRRQQAIRQKLAMLGLLEHVVFYETVPDMHSLVGACDLAILPLETMKDKLDIPTTLVECMAAGKPVVLSDLAPMNELLTGEDGTPSGVGAAVTPGDPAALAAAVIRILGDDELKRETGRKGALLAAGMFDIKETARRYEAIYREIG